MQISVSCDDGYKTEMHIVPEVTAKQLFEELCNLRRITGHDGEHAEYPQRPTVAFQPQHFSANAPQFIAAGVPLSSVLNGKAPIEGLPQFHVFGFKGLKQFAAIHEIQTYSAKITEMSQRLSSAIGLYAQNDHVEAQRVIAHLTSTTPAPLPALVSSRPSSSSSSSSSSSVAVSSSSLSTSTSSTTSLPTTEEVTAVPASLAVDAATNLAKTFVLAMHALLEKHLNGEEVLTMTARKRLSDAKDSLKSTNMVSLLKSLKLPRANIIIDEAAKAAAGVTTDADAPPQANVTSAQTMKAPAEKATANGKAPPASGKTSAAAPTATAAAPAAAAKNTTTPTVTAGPSEEVKLTRGQKAAATRAANKLAKQKTESEVAGVSAAVTVPAAVTAPAAVPAVTAPKPAPVPAAAPAPVPVSVAQLETQPMDVEESESESSSEESSSEESGSESDSSENSFANRMHSNTQTPHVNKTRTSVVTQSPIQKKEEVAKSSSGESESSSSEESSSEESESESESDSEESDDEEEPKAEQSISATTAVTTSASETPAVADAVAVPAADVIEVDQSSGESSSESESDSDTDSGEESDSESEDDSESDGESDSELVKTVVTQAPLPSALAEPLDVYAVNDSQATVFELPVKEKSPFSSGSESDTESSSDSSDESDSSSESEGEKEPLQLRKTSEHVKTPAPKKQISAKASSALKALSGGMLFTKSPSHMLPVHNRQKVVLTESQPALSDQESSDSGSSSSSDDSSDSEPESQESIVLTSTEPRVVPVSTPAPKSRNAEPKKSKAKVAPGELRNLINGTAAATTKNDTEITEIDANSSNTGKRSRAPAAGSNAKRSRK